MLIPKISVLLGLIVSLSTAQSIQISGVVKDSATGLPVQGAEVGLIRSRLSDTTIDDGSFTLSGEMTSSIRHAAKATALFRPRIIGEGIRLYLPEQGRVAVGAYSTQGKLLHSVHGDWQAGTHDISLKCPAPGVNIYRISLGNQSYTLTRVGMGGRSRFIPALTGPSPEASPLAKRMAAFEDTLVVSAAGYRLERVAVNEPVISGIEITCRKHVIIYADDVTDIDGNVYRTVVIGTQTWMAENLKTTRFNDSTSIPLVSDRGEWRDLSTPAYCWYNDDEAANKSVYGALYNWHTVETGKLAPTGWHVPADSEWQVLMDYLGGAAVAGGKLKEAGTDHWISPNIGATNEVGFTALPSGFRGSEAEYLYQGYDGMWWSSTASSIGAAFARNTNGDNTISQRLGSFFWYYGVSVRCVRD